MVYTQYFALLKHILHTSRPSTPLPPSAQVVAPCYAEAHAESEEAVPPDNRVAERRSVLQRVGDDDAGCERERGYESGCDSVSSSLEHAEKRDVGG